MAIPQSDSTRTNAPKPTDDKYGPYPSLAAAKAGVSLTSRYDGCTVKVVGDGEYWWLAGNLSDSGLLAKGIGLTTDQRNGIQNASTLSGTNPVATREDLVWHYLGDPLDGNVSRDLPDISNVYGSGHINNTYGSGVNTNVYGNGHSYNIYADLFYNNQYGNNHSTNIYGSRHQNNQYGDNHSYNTYGRNHDGNLYGNDLTRLYVGDNCQYLEVGDGCERLEIYNCQGDSGARFVIPSGTTDAVYRNNQLVIPGTGGSGLTVQWQSGVPLAKDVLTYNSTGDLFRVLQAITNPQVEPTYPVSSGLVPYYKYVGPALTADQKAALDASSTPLTAANPVVSVADLPPSVADVLEQGYSLVRLGQEVADPPQTFGPTGNKGWQPTNNGAYFFSAGFTGPARLFQPDPGAYGTFVTLRRGTDASSPQLVYLDTGIASSVSVEVGETVVLQLVSPTAATTAPGSTPGWQVHTRSFSPASSGSGGGPIDYTTPVTHPGNTTLTSADFGKHHLFTGTGSPLWTVALPSPTGNSGKVIGFGIGAGASGMWAFQAGNIDGKAERRLWAKETLLLLCTGTGYTKLQWSPVPLSMTLATSGEQALNGLGTVLFNTKISSTAPDEMQYGAQYALRALRGGIYLPSLLGYCAGGTVFRPIEVFAAKNGDISDVGTTNRPTPVVAGASGSGLAYASLELAANPVMLETGDFLNVKYYADASITLQNSGVIVPKYSLLEVPTWT
ncbi:hypothetical protein Q5H92_14830 [Hymenobacter sp. M29]|uniref:Uncharacterized protein n=1 Tax=Hymenobacter mellowenesis TaxID=3063995 RepID=A0ABT9AF80_9BACT|nr:hypothetical protein [Hymenobacter sp. M29]MDO7847641.1 hypothetical protein [Hymenobacter sp. M29]